MTSRERVAAQKAIIEKCANATTEQILGGCENGNLVIKLNDRIAVKWGVGVLEQEYLNQLEASRIVDPSIVRVPKAHDFFTDDSGRGYLVMDMVPGNKKDIIQDKVDLEAISRILRHFESLKSPRPGPLATRGPSYALLFGESDYPTFTATKDLELWFNQRLLSDDSPIRFSTSDLRLCHLDFFPRNILWETDKPPCLLDWLTAGFWPRIFERCSQLILEDCKSNPVVTHAPLKDAEHTQTQLIMAAWRNIQRYAL